SLSLRADYADGIEIGFRDAESQFPAETIYSYAHVQGAEPVTTQSQADQIEQIKGSHLNGRSEEHTSELQSRFDLVCRLLLEKEKKRKESNTDANERRH